MQPALFLLVLSVVLQFIAAGLALRLVRVTGVRGAWTIVAAAICLLPVQRLTVLVRAFPRGGLHRPDLAVELMALGVSLLLVAGIASIEPLFRAIAASQKVLRKERDFIAGVVDTVGALVVVLDREGRIVRFNRACETTTGYSAAEVLGKRVWELLLPAAERRGAEEQFQRLRAGNFPSEYENHWLTKEGGRRLIAWANTCLVDDGGKVEFIIGTGIDVTEHRQADLELQRARDELEKRVAERTAELSESNARLQEEVRRRRETEEALRESQEALRRSNEDLERVLDTMGDGVMVLDANHRMVRANRKMCEMLGYGEEELRGKDPSFWSHPESLRNMDEELRKRKRGEMSAYEARYVRKDGSTFYGLVTGAAIVDSDGTYHGAVGCIKDITERKRVEQLLAQHAEELARSNAELEQFAYIASHDLQEPLRKVRAFGDRLNSKFGDLLPEQGRDYLHRMVNASERMQQLINNLLDYSRVTTKARPFEEVDLNEVLRQVTSDLELQLERTGGRVEGGGLPTIVADATQMRQLLQNLIGNALKFSKPEEPPVVKVQGRVLPGSAGGEGAVCELTVEDNGIGFEPKHAERIFGVFQRLHGRDTYEGTGMGLAICRKITERHRGTITAGSRPGEGARFTVRLPVHQPRGTEA